MSEISLNSAASAPANDPGPCPCGSGKAYAVCCGPILKGSAAAETAEALMRSRYSAYVTGRLDFLAESLHPEHRDDLDIAATRRWSQRARWLNLEVVSSREGGPEDDQGEVEFIASYREKGVVKLHRERASFQRRDGVWYYVDGELVKPETAVHTQPKVGRNDPCPCGSGRKYKKCCGR